MNRLFLIRTILNVVFILLALGAMIGVVVADTPQGLNAAYAVCVVAVVIKMVEVALRMFK